VYTYSPSDISITFAGVPIEGFSSDNVVRINRIDPIYTSKRAMDGSVSVTKQKYSKWQVSIFLAQSSESNDLLNGVQKLLFSADIKELQYLPLIIKDNSGTTMFFAKDVWIEQLPELEFGQSLATREWVFMCNDVECIIGGNAEDLSGITEAVAVISLLQTAYEGSRNLVRIVRSL
jgi:hypothetical protein